MFRRNAELLVQTAMADTPVVLLNGARQTGKTTLVQAIAKKSGGMVYLTLDDPAVLAAAVHDPRGFIDGVDGTVVVDEVQKAPSLFPAIKLSVDRDRRPGRFLLTGSANVMALPALSESLAGRMEIVTLRPLSQGEIGGTRESFIDRLFTKGKPAASPPACTRRSLASRIHKGGYPEVVQRPPARRHNWFASYLTAILQRDVRDLSNIEGLTEAPRLLALVAARSAGLLNAADLSRDAGMPYTTLQRYMALFETTFLIRRVPAWAVNQTKRLVKAPKVLVCDTGFMVYLLNASEDAIVNDTRLSGRFFETFVGCELMKQIEWSASRPALLHYRVATGAEVDFVLEEGGRRIVGIEARMASTIGPGDFRGLQSLAEDAGERFAAGVVLYTGDRVVPFGARMWGVPIAGLWS